jgi:CDP-diacylglycerol---glycerol-3-phosphate 3-phosphatidyltransferase
MTRPILPGAHVPHAHASDALASGTRRPAGPWALPNLLTYARIAAVPVVVGCMYWSGILEKALWPRWLALAVFIAAAITDILDGYLARTWDQQSALGRMLDPIADKLLVASCLLMLAATDTIKGWSLWAAIVILCREVLVSGLREFLAELNVRVQVTRLAKWKTTVQLVAVGFLIAGEAGDAIMPGLTVTIPTLWTTGVLVGTQVLGLVTFVGIALLWISALLTLYTGWDYFRAGVKHLT